MNQAKLNTQLYQKMFTEQKLYRAGLLLLPPGEILNHAYEYVCRENILLSLEYNDLSSRQALALLNSPTPLADVFKKLENTGGSILNTPGRNRQFDRASPTPIPLKSYTLSAGQTPPV